MAPTRKACRNTSCRWVLLNLLMEASARGCVVQHVRDLEWHPPACTPSGKTDWRCMWRPCCPERLGMPCQAWNVRIFASMCMWPVSAERSSQQGVCAGLCVQGIIDYGEAHKHITATLQTLISQVGTLSQWLCGVSFQSRPWVAGMRILLSPWLLFNDITVPPLPKARQNIVSRLRNTRTSLVCCSIVIACCFACIAPTASCSLVSAGAA